MLYAPNKKGADKQGCINQSCTFSYTSKELITDKKHVKYYGTKHFNSCIAAAPDDTWQLVSYDVCYEDNDECTVDGLLCLYSKSVCK